MFMNLENQVNEMEEEDIEKNKVMGILAYILFFVPLLAARDSKFAKLPLIGGINLIK